MQFPLQTQVTSSSFLTFLSSVALFHPFLRLSLITVLSSSAGLSSLSSNPPGYSTSVFSSARSYSFPHYGPPSSSFGTLVLCSYSALVSSSSPTIVPNLFPLLLSSQAAEQAKFLPQEVLHSWFLANFLSFPLVTPAMR